MITSVFLVSAVGNGIYLFCAIGLAVFHCALWYFIIPIVYPLNIPKVPGFSLTCVFDFIVNV